MIAYMQSKREAANKCIKLTAKSAAAYAGRWVSEYIKTVSPNFLPQIKGIKTYRIIPSVKTCLNYLFPIVALTDTRKLKKKNKNNA